MRALVAVVAADRRLLRDGLAASLGLGALAVVPAAFVQLVLARLLPAEADRSLLVLSLVLMLLMAADLILSGLRAILADRLAMQGEARLATALFDRWLADPPAREGISAPARGLAGMEDLATVRRAAVALGRALPDGAAALFALPLMLWFAPLPAVLLLLALGMIALAALAGRKPLQRAAGAARAAAARRQQMLVSTLLQAATVAGLGLGAERQRRWITHSADIGAAETTLGTKLRPFDALGVLASTVLPAGALAVAVALAAWRRETVDVAPLVAFLLLARHLLAPLRHLGPVLRLALDAAAAVRALAEPLAEPLADTLAGLPASETGEATPAGVAGELCLRGVRFTYPGASPPVLQEVSFTVPAGAMVGLTGRNGAGKSTLAALLQRPPVDGNGTVDLDGRDMRSLTRGARHRAVLVVSGTDTILAGTVRQTLMALRPGAPYEVVARATRVAAADEFIEQLPRGIETGLHDGAPILSPGQRQRLALAAALVADPPVLVLDDALGALDPAMADLVTATLRDARQGRTTLVLSRRIAALSGCSTILLLENGRIADEGSHEDLLGRSPSYAEAWRREQGWEDEPDANEGAERLAIS